MRSRAERSRSPFSKKVSYLLHLGERVSPIEVEDEEKVIKGRLDLLVMSQTIRTRDDSPFWVLLIEAKNSEIAVSAGLAQLLVYAHKALQRQERVWGLVTNGGGLSVCSAGDGA